MQLPTRRDGHPNACIPLKAHPGSHAATTGAFVTYGRETGQAVVLLVVASSLFMFGALGLAIDGGQMYAHRQLAQAAADAAALSAMMSILRGTNSTSAHPFSTSASFTCAVPPATLDLRTPCVYAQNNGFGKTSDTVTVSFPSSISGATLSSVSTPAVRVTVQRQLATTFMRFLGPSTATVSAKASAGMLGGTGSNNCLYVLDPTASKALTVSGGSTSLTLGCGVAINSNDNDGADVSGGATVTASSFTTAGSPGYHTSGSSTISPTPTSGAPAVSDPFASVVGPTPGSCWRTNYTLSGGTATIDPGTYCGGITVTGGGALTLNGGTYIMNGGGFTISASSVTSASGVMIYLTGTNSSYRSATISGASTVTLSAETYAPYRGMLFFQDQSITSNQNATFSGGSNMRLTGSLYFPTTTLTYSGGSGGASTVAILAQQVTFSGGSSISADTTGALTGLGGGTTVGLLE